MPVSPRRAAEAGFTLVTVMGVMLIASLLSVATFAAVNGDARESGKDVGRKQALAAAEAGVNDYLFHLNEDNAYWTKCTNVAAPNRGQRRVERHGHRSAQVAQRARKRPPSTRSSCCRCAPYSKCTPGTNVASSMIDASSRTLRIRVTGRVPTANGHGLSLGHRRGQARRLPGLPVLHRLRDERLGRGTRSPRTAARPAVRRATSSAGRRTTATRPTGATGAGR